ncbi:S1 RNA binding domain protein [Candidatus Moduliflexus flocculans]|uniref:S1 RNA binding domain protein n=1 Tax=Candidatus Moduliflexus flocculans TaxID=1499966 RepID=A0A081BNS1_9BACT|nr:S1 RNA binding domain protein [Candidatus Moduliflexus flocculans]
MIQIGKIQSLPVSRLVSIGAFLSAGSGDAADDILLPNNQVPPETQVGDVLEVFIYRDSEDRLIATRQKPYIQVGELAALKVVEMTEIGAFLDWGLEKDLFLPFREQKIYVREGKRYLVAAYLDKQNRICATTDVEKYLLTESPFKKDDIVQGCVFSVKPDFGAFVAIENKYIGLIPKSEYFTSLHVGDQLELRVAVVREDGKITLSPRQLAYKQIENDVALILRQLEDHNGVLPVNDDSHPGAIKRYLQLSKKAFKRALGRLLKIKRVEQIEGGIRLLPETEETERLRREAEEQSQTPKTKPRVSYVPEALREPRSETRRFDAGRPKSFRPGSKRSDSPRPRRFESDRPASSRGKERRFDEGEDREIPRPRRFESDRPAFSRAKERRFDEGEDRETPRPRRFESDRPAFSRAKERRFDGEDRETPRPRRFESDRPAFSRAKERRFDGEDRDVPRPRRFESDRPAFSRAKERRFDGEEAESPRPRRFESERPVFSQARRERDDNFDKEGTPRPRRQFESDRPVFSRAKERRVDGEDSESSRPRSQRTFSKRPFREDSEKEGESRTRPFFKKTAPKFGKRPGGFPRRPSSK